MGTVSHHQAMAREFLHRADQAMSTHDPTEAGVAQGRVNAFHIRLPNQLQLAC